MLNEVYFFLKVLLQRLKEAEQFEQWEAQEDQVGTVNACCTCLAFSASLLLLPMYTQFHLEQAKLRSKIRIESGRGKFYLIFMHKLNHHLYIL